SGTVTNGGGADAGVPIDLLVDGSPEGALLASDTNGIISTPFAISSSLGIGPHNFSIRVSSSHYDVTSSSGYWIIQVNVTSRLSVSFESTPSLMPGESFVITFTLVDQDNDRHEGEIVDVFLNETYLMSITIDAASPHNQTVVINPLLWGARSGYYVAIVVYPGTQYVVGSSAETRESIHVFHDVAFTRFSPTYGVINNPLTLSGVLVDPNGAPIEGRTITLTRNDSLSFDLITDANGQFTHQTTETFTAEGTYTLFVSFTRADSTVASDSYSFEITSGLPPGFDTALLITWAVIVAIEAVVAMLIVARYRYKGRGFVIPRLGFSERASEIHDSLVR
ncbi:MAG: carboxypeptidase-like regulatory domain-containing protein, partial [Candidatus Thorarchaeota archaeon]